MGDGHIAFRETNLIGNYGNVWATKTSWLGDHDHVILRLSYPEPRGAPAGHCSRLAAEHFPASLNVYTISGSRWLTRQGYLERARFAPPCQELLPVFRVPKSFRTSWARGREGARQISACQTGGHVGAS
jgi:hypothetical protein